MIHLSYDIWTAIARYLPKGTIRTLYAVNSAFFAMAMEDIYRELTLSRLDEMDTVRVLNLSPLVAFHVRKLTLRAQLFAPSNTSKHTGRVKGAMWKCSQALGRRKPPPPALASRILMERIGSMKYLVSVKVFWHHLDEPVDMDSLKTGFSQVVWPALIERVHELAIEWPVEGLVPLFPPTPHSSLLSRLRQVDISLWKRQDTKQEEVSGILSQSLSPFLHAHRMSIDALTIQSSKTSGASASPDPEALGLETLFTSDDGSPIIYPSLDLDALFALYDGSPITYPSLRYLCIRPGENSHSLSTLPSSSSSITIPITPTAFTQFLTNHAPQLNTLSIDFLPPPPQAILSPKQLFAHPFFALPLPSITSLDLGLLPWKEEEEARKWVVPYLQPKLSTLTHLALSNIVLRLETLIALFPRCMQFPEPQVDGSVSPNTNAHSKRPPDSGLPLRHLQIHMRYLSKTLFDQLSERLECLEVLNLRADAVTCFEDIPESELFEPETAITDNAEPGWKKRNAKAQKRRERIRRERALDDLDKVPHLPSDHMHSYTAEVKDLIKELKQDIYAHWSLRHLVVMHPGYCAGRWDEVRVRLTKALPKVVSFNGMTRKEFCRNPDYASGKRGLEGWRSD